MQTFLPYSSYYKSSQCLDDRRLGKQRVEVLQILTTLVTDRRAWSNHPAVRMWRGCEFELAIYGLHICDEWIRRGFKDTCRDKILELVKSNRSTIGNYKPVWLGREDFHRSHQSNLVRKNPNHYREIFPEVPDDLPCVWPILKQEMDIR